MVTRLQDNRDDGHGHYQDVDVPGQFRVEPAQVNFRQNARVSNLKIFHIEDRAPTVQIAQNCRNERFLVDLRDRLVQLVHRRPQPGGCGERLAPGMYNGLFMNDWLTMALCRFRL